MRWALLLALCFVPVVAADDDKQSVDQQINAILWQAGQQHFEAVTKADQEYRAAVAKTFQFADRIEVFLLDFSMGADPAYEPKKGDAVFEIRPEEKKTKIIKFATVPANELAKWREAAAKLYRAKIETWAAGCHYPVHGIRIYAGDKLLLETSFCWKCSNYYFTNASLGSSWVTMGKDADDVKTLLHELSPIPEDEKRRFDAGPQRNWKGGIF